MSFLNPALLFGMFLIGLPILIHLLNRRRHRTVEWGAMMFLLRATRQLRGPARIRQILIMLARMLAIATLVFAIARPLASGWLGSVAGGADTAVILLDRSPSMERQDLQSGRSKRRVGIERISEAMETLGVPPNVVLIDSGSVTPRPIDDLGSLAELPSAGPADGHADLPGMLESAFEYLQANQSGRTDVWICSDLQREDWNPDTAQWEDLRAKFGLQETVRFRLLSYRGRPGRNLSVEVEDIQRKRTEGGDELWMDIVVRREGGDDSLKVPLAIVVDGARTVLDLTLDGEVVRLADHRVPLSGGQRQGWGQVELPGDANPRDNVYYFAYGEEPVRRSVVVTEDPEEVRAVALALSPPDGTGQASTVVIAPGDIGSVDWDQTGFIAWKAPLPVGSTAARLSTFVDQGGVVLFFPPKEDDANAFMDVSWGPWGEIEGNESKKPTTWRSDSGLLRRTQSGDALPVGDLEIRRWRSIQGPGIPLAQIADSYLLTKRATDRGAVYFCGTGVEPADSNLSVNGISLFVMLQRGLSDGCARLANAFHSVVGRSAPHPPDEWERLGGWQEGALSTQRGVIAGVYRIPGDRLMARNRPIEEDLGPALERSEVEGLFGDVDLEVIEDDVTGETSLVNEVWRLFLLAMLFALIAEAMLCLPSRTQITGPTIPGALR